MEDAMNEGGIVEGIIEAVLFAVGDPVEAEQLAEAADIGEKALEETVAAMNDDYEQNRRGITIKKIEGRYQLASSPVYAENVRKCLNLEKKKPLSRTLLETLAIIAYMQPVTKQQIMEIRGVDAKHAVNKLMEKGLVCEMGRHEAPGRPLLFGTTDEFLRKFGFSSISEMPLTMQKIEESLTDGENEEDSSEPETPQIEEPDAT